MRYEINIGEATQFCCWTNKILKEYMMKGFVLDKELLKILFAKVSNENIKKYNKKPQKYSVKNHKNIV